MKKKPRGFNVFVAPHNHTYQLDIFVFSEDIEAKHKFRAGLVIIDVLSKYAVCGSSANKKQNPA